MNEIEHSEILELLPAYALGSLEESDGKRVAAHLASCAVCRAELAQYEAVVDLLPAAVTMAQPAADLKDRLLTQARASRSEQSVTNARPASRSQQWRVWLPVLTWPRWSPALALIALIFVLGAVLLWRQAQTPSRFELTSTEAAPKASGLIEVAANGRQATLRVSGLPPLSPEQQYQLWLIRDGQRASGAVFSVAADGSAEVPVEASQPLEDYGAFGITIEPAGGSPGPTGQRVLGYNL